MGIKSKNKKAAIEVQFNWIFVLIAGAMILAFFITIVVKQKFVSEQAISATVLTSLESILTGAKVSIGATNTIDLPPKTEIKFGCDEYSIGDMPKQTKTRIIFAPDLIKGRKMVTWALGWSLPYRVTNFLYLTSPDVKYVIVGSGDLAKEINKTLPDEISKEIASDIEDAERIKYKNNYQTKFIFVDTSGVITLDYSFRNADVTAIQIIPESEANSGTIKFYEKDPANPLNFKLIETTYYLKIESLIGAIFSGNAETYNCVMKKAFKKLSIITSIYQERSTALASYYSSQGSACDSYHSTLDINEIADVSSVLSGPSPLELSSFTSLLNSVNSLKDQNKEAQLYSCALIY